MPPHRAIPEDANKPPSSTPTKFSFLKVIECCQLCSVTAPLPVRRAGLGLFLGTFYKQCNHRIERAWVEILPSDHEALLV